MASSSSYSSPCAACKFLRRKCMPGCIFAPYFPPEEPHKFANVHKIFGASNVTKLLNELPTHQREDAVNSLAYEAEARIRDPVYGCVGAISYLQREVQRLQRELDAANSELIRYACNEIPSAAALTSSQPVTVVASSVQQLASTTTQRPSIEYGRRIFDEGGGFYQPTAYTLPYNIPWHENPSGDIDQGRGGGGGSI